MQFCCPHLLATASQTAIFYDMCAVLIHSYTVGGKVDYLLTHDCTHYTNGHQVCWAILNTNGENLPFTCCYHG